MCNRDTLRSKKMNSGAKRMRWSNQTSGSTNEEVSAGSSGITDRMCQHVYTWQLTGWSVTAEQKGK